jgi:glycosyltransferase involved in cell wall biosynthesis
MKISFIMQAYLGEYPGSRSNSVHKFHRAVKSFIDQTDKESELIIVSDGCNIVHQEYFSNYKDNDRIKYVFVDKDTPNMYEGEKKYYRGVPRQVGRSLATGEITTYIDSDDYLLNTAVESIKKNWNAFPPNSIIGIYNSSWVDNFVMVDREELLGEKTACSGDPFKIEDLDSFWINRKMTHVSLILSSTWSMIHRSDFEGKWEDTIGDPSEDVCFSLKLQKTKKVAVMNEPYYVRCHYSNLWDY